jgi:hypothetical protein
MKTTLMIRTYMVHRGIEEKVRNQMRMTVERVNLGKRGLKFYRSQGKKGKGKQMLISKMMKMISWMRWIRCLKVEIRMMITSTYFKTMRRDQEGCKNNKRKRNKSNQGNSSHSKCSKRIGSSNCKIIGSMEKEISISKIEEANINNSSSSTPKSMYPRGNRNSSLNNKEKTLTNPSREEEEVVEVAEETMAVEEIMEVEVITGVEVEEVVVRAVDVAIETTIS